MTTPEADQPAATAPAEAPGQQPSPPPLESPSAESEPSPFYEGEMPEPVAPPVVARAPDSTMPMPVVTNRSTATVAAEREVTYVPLAVTVGDGFKFGCGFFLAMVIAVLVGFVVLAALFVLTGLSVLNLPFGR